MLLCPARLLTNPPPYHWFALYLLRKDDSYLILGGMGLLTELTGRPVGQSSVFLKLTDSPFESVMLIWMAVVTPAWSVLSQSVRLCMAMP